AGIKRIEAKIAAAAAKPAVSAVAAPAASREAAAAPEPRSGAVHRPVNASDLMGGYIPEGTRAEVEGFIGAKDGVVMFKYHPVSAQYPMTIMTGSLSRDLLEKIATR